MRRWCLAALAALALAAAHTGNVSIRSLPPETPAADNAAAIKNAAVLAAVETAGRPSCH